jgi:hypothetical protein
MYTALGVALLFLFGPRILKNLTRAANLRRAAQDDFDHYTDMNG